MVLRTDVVVTSSAGYSVRLNEAKVDVKTNRIISDQPVEVTLSNGTVKAHRLEVSDNGDVMLFEGDVDVSLVPQPAAPAAPAGRRDRARAGPAAAPNSSAPPNASRDSPKTATAGAAGAEPSGAMNKEDGSAAKLGWAGNALAADRPSSTRRRSGRRPGAAAKAATPAGGSIATGGDRRGRTQNDQTQRRESVRSQRGSPVGRARHTSPSAARRGRGLRCVTSIPVSHRRRRRSRRPAATTRRHQAATDPKPAPPPQAKADEQGQLEALNAPSGAEHGQ